MYESGLRPGSKLPDRRRDGLYVVGNDMGGFSRHACPQLYAGMAYGKTACFDRLATLHAMTGPICEDRSIKYSVRKSAEELVNDLFGGKIKPCLPLRGAAEDATAREEADQMGINANHFQFGKLEKGPHNRITDVPGVKVGSVTKADGDIQTGVTVLLPCEDSPFRRKLPAAAHMINGFGKSVGLMQIMELGTLESPIVLTNTFSVDVGIGGILTKMLADHPEIGDTTGTVNPVVMECNDGRLNDIRRRVLREEDVLAAFACAAEEFEEGAVGSGRGMCCYGLKGGLGTASRILSADGRRYTVGALLMTNFGRAEDLTVCGRKIGRTQPQDEDRGSVVMILATDLPLTARQLGRCTRRAQNGLARTGSYTGNGSGEIALMFSTANRIPHSSKKDMISCTCLREDLLDRVFEAVADCVEESVISSLWHAETVTGKRGRTVMSLRDAKLLP